jgi:hypothetical protein
MPDSNKVVRYGWENLSQEEGTLSEAVSAGDLLELGGSDDYQAHSTDGGSVDRVLVAMDERGRGYVAGDDYSSGEFITAAVANSGVGLHLNLASGDDLGTAADATISVGDQLVSAGDGTVRAFNADDPDDVVAIAEEAIDNSSGGAGNDTPLAVEVTR